MKPTRADVIRAIMDRGERTRAPLPLPAEHLAEFILGRYPTVDVAIIEHACQAFIGAFEDPVAAAKGYAADAYPPPESSYAEAFACIDWDSWPFNHIDWPAAAAQLAESVDRGTITVAGGLYWFETSTPVHAHAPDRTEPI
ncbi:hypothetical protein [Rathayibacter rathayi]|uniref:Uncharacterized protein n=1 Tax=Rathayibacter rathayi TaxID=33887 RepID=A0ABX5AIR0_RATRA|nr:hypothetical protein [Rathayibacter rathayi]PPF23109.1 hypothetical protein C5C34_09780 [Rathayibacter rathayi]PPF51627.1 hypothetical protein C5C08_02140 [Rathayibacter rathayi]PPF83217.1 hypothetical protein C5C14_02175 [Rathayibacter rathayi]PPG47048.1 hypothetical protein C5C20_02135 [Rathayibacter rathayi]PPG94071.1 hypothetical protein C5C22_09650 [Rathayibacter rathayi]